jgi:type III restriction enzyme
VAELEDWRTLVVEYKGQHIKHDLKEIKKVQVGKLWQSVSNRQAVFVQVEVEVAGLNMRDQMAKAIARP